MDPFAKPTTSQTKPSASAVNPFAKALAETEKSFSDQQSPSASSNSVFSEALARTGGQLGDSPRDPNQMAQPSQADLLKQQQEAAEKRRKEIIRRKLHDQINPVDQTAVFDAREKRVKEELEKTRQELKMLAREIAEFRQDIDIAATKQVVSPGLSGDYYVSFFQKLRSFIMLLRQKVHSARTWASQMQSKSGKKQRGKGQAGMEIGGNRHEQTKTIFDIMHHERQATYGGS